MSPLLPPDHPPEAAGRAVSHLPLPVHLRAPTRALYAVAGAVAAIPLFQVAPQIWPPAPGSTAWRYSAYATIAAHVLAPMSAAILAHWVAALRNDRPKQALLAAGCFAAGVGFLVATPLFIHDYLSLRRSAASVLQGSIDSAAWRAIFAALVSGLTLAFVGATGWTSAWTPPPGLIKKKGGNGGLVVAQDEPDSRISIRQGVQLESRTD